jgi:hypothetical protein
MEDMKGGTCSTHGEEIRNVNMYTTRKTQFRCDNIFKMDLREMGYRMDIPASGLGKRAGCCKNVMKLWFQ